MDRSSFQARYPDSPSLFSSLKKNQQEQLPESKQGAVSDPQGMLTNSSSPVAYLNGRAWLLPSSVGHLYYQLSIAGVLRVQSVPNCRDIHPIQAQDSLQVLVALLEKGKLSCSSRFFVLFVPVFKNPFKGLGPCDVMLMIPLLQIDSDRASFSSQRRGSPWMQNRLTS